MPWHMTVMLLFVDLWFIILSCPTGSVS
jgi:hypothetical protein